MITYFSWWYGQELINIWQAILIITQKLFANFSVPLLLRTLADPWKRDIVAVENASLNEQIQVMLANFVSRLVGFMLRVSTIIVGTVLTFFSFILMIIIFAAWICMPIIVMYLIVNGLILIINGPI